MASIDDPVANTRLGMFSKWIISYFEFVILRYYNRNPRAREAMRVVEKIFEEERGSLFEIIFRGYTTVLFSPGELLNVYWQAWNMRNHGGGFAEVGTFRGASAKAICEAKDKVPLHLFDTWTGLPETGKSDTRFKKGMFSADMESVRERLSWYDNVHFYPGLFPGTTCGTDVNYRFSFVHLDVDLEDVTFEALKFFYPRMLPGGIILSHDYGQCEGVWKAFDKFFEGKSEQLQTVHSQVMVVKK